MPCRFTHCFISDVSSHCARSDGQRGWERRARRRRTCELTVSRRGDRGFASGRRTSRAIATTPTATRSPTCDLTPAAQARSRRSCSARGGDGARGGAGAAGHRPADIRFAAAAASRHDRRGAGGSASTRCAGKLLVGSLAEVERAMQAAEQARRAVVLVHRVLPRHLSGLQAAPLDRGFGAHRIGRWSAVSRLHWNRQLAHYDVRRRGRKATEPGGAMLGHAIHAHDLADIYPRLGASQSPLRPLHGSTSIETEDSRRGLCSEMGSGAPGHSLCDASARRRRSSKPRFLLPRRADGGESRRAALSPGGGRPALAAARGATAGARSTRRWPASGRTGKARRPRSRRCTRLTASALRLPTP